MAGHKMQCLDFGFQYTLIRNNRSKKIWGRILDLAQLKFAVAALNYDINIAKQFSHHYLSEMHTSPYILRASSANHSKNPFEYPISPLASAKGFPCSIVKSFAKSSLCSSQRLNHFLSNIDLSLTVVSFHEAKAY